MRNPRSYYSKFYIAIRLTILAAILAPASAGAHCAGKHTGNHPHCSGGEDPPPQSDANPVIVALDEGFKERIVVMDDDGGNLTEIVRQDFKSWYRIQWSPGGSFVAWPGNQSCAVGGWLMVPFDRVSGNWGTLTQLACLDSITWAGLHFQVIPTLHPDENTVQMILNSENWDGRGLSADQFSLDSGGIHITAPFAPGSQTGATVDTLQLIPVSFNESGQTVGLHHLALSRNASWLVYRLGDLEDILDSFAIRPFNTSAITNDVTGITAADVTGEIAVQVFSTDLGIGHMEEYDFAEHAEETFVFSADGKLYCVDFSSVNGPAELPLAAEDVEIVNLTAGILPANASANAATWRPDGTGVAFGAVLNAGTTKSEQVIAEIIFDMPSSMGCPYTSEDTEMVTGTFSVIAGGGTGRKSSRLFQPNYRRNIP